MTPAATDRGVSDRLEVIGITQYYKRVGEDEKRGAYSNKYKSNITVAGSTPAARYGSMVRFHAGERVRGISRLFFWGVAGLLPLPLCCFYRV